jgi:Ca2+-binding EF-hand superfamily protein
MKVVKTELYGLNDVRRDYADQFEQGRHYIRKMVALYKSGNMDYLSLCNILRKIYNSFDFTGNACLSKLETRHLLECFSAEMNTIMTQMKNQSFKQWFEKIDTDGNQVVSLDELVSAFCKLFKFSEPSKKQNVDVPKELIKMNTQLRSNL